MINLNLFTSGKHTKPVIEGLKKATNIDLVNIVKKLPRKSDSWRIHNKVDVFIVADFGEIIPKEILAIPKNGSLCLHPSLLPKYRGASPVEFSIINGEKETGLTIFEMDEKVDHGPIISQFKEKIRDDDTTESLYERLFQAGAEVLITVLPAYLAGKIKPRAQDHSKATYTRRLTRRDGKIDWKKSDREIERFIRAMHPWPGTWTPLRSSGASERQAKRLKILKAHLEKEKLTIDQVQLEGKEPISFKQFLAGHPTYRFS